MPDLSQPPVFILEGYCQLKRGKDTLLSRVLSAVPSGGAATLWAAAVPALQAKSRRLLASAAAFRGGEGRPVLSQS